MTNTTNDYFNILFNRTYFTVIFIIFIYSLLKERHEFGCSSWFKIKKHCNDVDSIYFKGTQPLKSDSKEILSKKIKSILSIHKKHAIWRKCFIISTIIIFFAKGLNQDIKAQSLIGIHLVTMSIIYFYHNFMNFHVNRVADNLGSEIVDMLVKSNNKSNKFTKSNYNKTNLNKTSSTDKVYNKQQMAKLFSK